MNQISYKLALIHRDELLREAAGRRLASGPGPAPGPHVLGLIQRAGPTLRRLSPLGLASQS